MRIAHIADIHWGVGYPGPTPQSRFDDITRVMNWTADKIIAEQCNLVLVAGDIFRKADISLEKSSEEIIACTDWLRKITEAGIEIIIISGTPSHDPAKAYKLLINHRIPLVHIYTQPGVYHIWRPSEKISIACLPGLDRSNFASRDEYKGMPAHQMHQAMTTNIANICRGMRAQIKNPAISILMAHMTYEKADKGFDDLMMQQEALLTQEAIDGYDLVTMGHIHRPQQNGIVFYSGSPERLSFNDEKVDAGFWIHEWDEDGQKFDSQFIDTPARHFITLQLSENQIADFVNGNLDFDTVFDNIRNAIVRIRYACSEDLNKALNRRTLEKALYDMGAFFVAEIKGDIERLDRARDEEVTEALGPIEAVQKWAENQEFAQEEISELTAMTAQLMEVTGHAL